MAYFEDGDFYSARADFERFTTIENQLDLVLKLTGGGVINGWGIVQTSDQVGTRAVTILPGFGIVPFTIDETDPTTGVVTKKQHFIGVRTNSPIIVPNLGPNRKSVIYIELNRQILDALRNNPDVIVDLSEETITVAVRPSAGSPAGSGPFRTTTATNEAGLETDPDTGEPFNDYPIYFRKIDGLAFVPDNNKVVVFLNGRQIDSGYSISGTQGNVIQFENPLSPEDNVTVRLDPLNSLVIGEVTTDDTKVTEINNDVKEFAREKSANDILAEELFRHVHDALESNPAKILLTTQTAEISPDSSTENRIFTFNKPDSNLYGFDFDEGTYSSTLFINGFVNIDDVTIVDNGDTITVTFTNRLDASDILTLVLSLNDNQTQIENKLKLTGNNPSEEKIDFEISAEKIATGILDPLLIPPLSHIGRYREIFRPANDPANFREFVHRTETFDYTEFFPVHKDKSNARNARFLFLEQKSASSEALIHAAASNGFLYMESDSVMFNDPITQESDEITPDSNTNSLTFVFSRPTSGDFPIRESKTRVFVNGARVTSGISVTEADTTITVTFDTAVDSEDTVTITLVQTLFRSFTGGWSHITLNRDINEYDAPFSIIPVKDPINVTSNNWDRLFYVGNRFVTQNTWSDVSNPALNEVVNLSADINTSEFPNTITDIRGTKIFDACGGKSPMNMDKTAYILLDNKVYLYEYINSESKYFWLDITNGPLWTQAESLSCIDVNGNTILCVGTDDGEVYCNLLVATSLSQTLAAGGNFIPQGNVDFGPLEIWEKGEFSYGYGYSDALDFFDVFGVRGNNFGVGPIGFGSGAEEKLPLKTGDNLLFVSTAGAERRQIATVQDNAISLVSEVTETFTGESSGLANSMMMLDWFRIADSLTGVVKKVIFAQNRLIVMTDETVYVSDEVGDITNLYFKETFSFVDSLPPIDVHNDINVVNGVLILASEGGLYRGVFNGSGFDWTISQNTDIGESLNDMLFPGFEIVVDDNIAYLLGKYGIFKTVDSGLSWRNTIQILELPEDFNSSLTVPKISLKVVATDPANNRIIAIRSDFPYGYGYGYGFGEGADFFDVFGISSTTLGYGVPEFESNFAGDYGYGFGFELLSILEAIDDGDWILFDENSGSLFEDLPLRILDVGVDADSNLFFIEIELADGEKADFNEIVANQIFSIYDKKDPLAIIDGIPQDRRYESTDIISYTSDFFRQSISFAQDIDPENEVTIASEYKAFEPINDSILDLSIDELRVRGLITEPLSRDISTDNFIAIEDTGNIDDIVRSTIKGTNITNVGENTHEEIEDALSIEELGLPYKFEGVRTSNLLMSIMSMQHLYPDVQNSVTNTEITGVVDEVGTDYIKDTSFVFARASLVGRRIILDSGNKTFDYTIENNTEDTIYIQRYTMFNDFSDEADGSTTTFEIEENAAIGKLKVYLDGVEQVLGTDYTTNIIGGEIASFTFSTAPPVGSFIISSYIATRDDIDFTDVVSAGDSYKIIGIEASPFSELINTFTTMFNETSVLDVEFSFIENSIVISNDNIGRTTNVSFYVYFNPLDDFIYAGTNKGIWRRAEDVSIYRKTSSLIPTINATGPITVADDINGAFLQYNEDTGEWTFTWGLGVTERDVNDNLSQIDVTAIAHNPADSNIILAGSAEALYRTLDGGSTWNVIKEFKFEERIKDFPIPRQIVFDDKNPWIVNLVNQSGLFRSFDYGNTFELIANYDIARKGLDASRSFTYQIESTDVRGYYYYGENGLQIKTSKDLSSFGNDTTRPMIFSEDSVKVSPFDMIGVDVGDLFIRSVANNPSNVNELFVASDVYGLYKSTQMGNDRAILFDDFKKSYAVLTSELIDEIENANDLEYTNNTGAFHFLKDPDRTNQQLMIDNDTPELYDPDAIVGRYTIFVDRARNRTYVLTKVVEGKRIPEDGEFAGRFIRLQIQGGSEVFRIIGNYNRGKLPSASNVIDRRGNDISGVIIEFVLEGQYPFLYNSANLPLNRTVEDYDYYWYGDTSFSIIDSPTLPFNRNYGFKMPLFSPFMGREDKSPVADGDFDKINGTGINARAVFRSSDTLSSVASAGNTVYTVTKPSIDLYGYTYDFDPGEFEIQVFLNGDLIGQVDISNTNTFTFVSGSTITATIADAGSTVTITLDSSLSATDTITARLIVINSTTLQKENLILIEYPVSGAAPPVEFTADDGLAGYFIGETQEENRYEIFNSKVQTNLTAEQIANFQSIISLRIDPTENPQLRADELDSPVRLWNNEASNSPPDTEGLSSSTSLFHSGIIASATTNSITFTQGKLPTIATAGYDLTGFIVFPRSNLGTFFKVVSNTDDTIVLDGTDLDDLIIIGDTVRFGSAIQSARVKDIIIDPSDNETMYVSAIDNPYMTTDSGRTWRLINEGLDFNIETRQSLVRFERLRISNSILYACALNVTPEDGGGVFRFDGSTWTQIGGVSGDGLTSTAINDITVFENGGITTIYAGTSDDGIYKGTGSGTNFTWTRQNLPEHNVEAINLVRDSSGDLDRIWIGTRGRGIWRKDGISDTTWENDVENNLEDVEIKSNFWRAWNIFEESGEVIVNALTVDTTRINAPRTIFDERSYSQTIYEPIESKGLETLDIFDWASAGTIIDDKDLPYIVAVDTSNSTFISERASRTITDSDSPGFHKLTNYISGIAGAEREAQFIEFGIRDGSFGISFNIVGSPQNDFGVEKVNVSGSQKTIYEEPFGHLPDRQSITTIEESDTGRVFLGTDRSGVWRTKSNDGRRFLLPFVENPVDAFDVSNYGYDYVSGRFERFLPTTLSDFPNQETFERVTKDDPTGAIGFIEKGKAYDGIRTTDDQFRAEKIYKYTVNSTDNPLLFSDLSSDTERIIGGYFVVSQTISESRGLQDGRNSFTFEITDVKSSGGNFEIFLSAGSRLFGFPIEPKSDPTWDDIDAEIETPSGNLNKIVIVDYESYEDISGNLPRIEVKNARDKKESGVFVRDMKLEGSQAIIACGIGGLYISKDVHSPDPDSVEWFNIELPSGITDVTSVETTALEFGSGYGYGYGTGLDFFDVFGYDGSLVGYGDGYFESVYAYSYGYGTGFEFKLDIFIGTWGDGVWVYRGGYWDGDIFTGGTWSKVDSSGLLHQKIWKLFISSENILYAGTEHGGIYTSNVSSGSTWTRQLDNVVRSKLFMWKTEGIPTKKDGTNSDFSGNSNLLSYSFGGGIMRSLDEGATWEQVITGLDNLYVQDIAICSDASTDTAYAATAGGGVFKTTDAFSGNCIWTQMSIDELPSTLNVDEIEVGFDPNIVYIKSRINDLSFKDLPLSLKNVAATPLAQEFEKGVWLGSLNSSLFRDRTFFTPIFPYTKGQRKSVILRSANGGSSWSTIFDKDPNLTDEYSFSSSVFGLTMRPGDEDVTHFLYRSSLSSNNSDIGNIERFIFVTLEDGSVSSEIAFPFDSYQNLKLFNQRSDAYISVNPQNTNEIYISLHGEFGRGRNIPPIYISEDGGSTWNYATGHFTSTESFNTKVQISNKSASSVSASISQNASALSLVAPTSGIENNTAQFEEARDFYVQNFNRIMIANFQQDTSFDPYGDSLFFTYRDEPVVGENNQYPRPFYLTGATLQINTNQTRVISVSDGGNRTFLPRTTKNIVSSSSPQFVTLVLDETYAANTLLPIGNQCRLGNLTSLIFNYSSLPSDSIIRKENSLIGLDATINGTVYKVGIHRALYSSTTATSPDRIELVIIGSVTASSGTTVTIDLEPAIYSNYDNDLMMSVNKGMSWKKIGKETFSIALDDVKSVVDNGDLPTTSPATVRSTYLMKDESENSVIYRGDVRDDRFDDGESLDIVWSTVVASNTFKSARTLQDGLAFSEGQNAIFISEIDRIRKISLPSATVSTVFEDIAVSVPLTVSQADSNAMAFIANNSIYTSKDGFTTTQIFNLPQSINASAIQKLVLSKNIEAPDEMFMCVDNGQIIDQASSSVLSITSFGVTNIVNIPLSGGQQNPFVGFERRFLSFENNGSTSIYNTRILRIAFDTIFTLETIRGSATGFEYNNITNRTLIKCSAVVNNITDYIGNVISLQTQNENPNSIFVGRIEEIDNITETSFDVIVNGDLRSSFTSNNIDFNLKFPFFRIGRISDFLGDDFAGSINTSRTSTQTEQNGLWFSNTFGEGFIQIDGIEIGGDDDHPGCIDVHLFDSGEISPVVTTDGLKRIMLNDKFLPSPNINRVVPQPDGSIIGLTDNGLFILTGEESPVFESFFFNDFTQILDTGANQFLLFDREDNTFVLNGIPQLFFGNETPDLTDFEFSGVTVSFQDSNGVVWIGTQQSGLFAIFNNIVFNFTIQNSEIGSNTIKDVTEDSRQNIWIATAEGGVSFGNYGDDINDIPTIVWSTFATGIGFTANSGLTGEINAVKERLNLTIVADGTQTVPSIVVRWANNSSVFPNSIILRNESGVTPTITNGEALTFEPIRDTAASIVATTTATGTNVWRITGTLNIDYGTNSVIGKVIVPDTRNSNSSFAIIENSFNTFDIARTDGVDVPSIGEFMVTDQIGDAFVVFTGDGTEINFELEDTDLINDRTYNYYLFFYNDVNFTYKLTGSKQTQISSSTIFSDSELDIIAGGSGGIFKFNPGGSQDFDFVKSIGNTVTDIFFDTSNIGWIAAGDKIVEFNAPNITTDYTLENLFAGKLDLISEELEVRNAGERENGDIVIATNVGLSIFEDGTSFTSFIDNDPDRSLRAEDGALSLNSWRAAKVVDDNANRTNFIRGDSVNEAFLSVRKDILYTSNKGAKWDVANSSSQSTIVNDVEFAYRSNNDDGSIKDLIFVSDRSFLSSGDGTADILSSENLPNRVVSSESFSAGDMWLSERTGSDFRLIVGMFNDNVIEDEREIALLDFTSPDEFTSPATFITGRDGLSIQSVYDFAEIESGSDKIICAGAKDSIIFKKNTDPWKVFETNEVEQEVFAYTSLSARVDDSSIEHGKTLYATRTSLYQNKTDQELISLRIDEPTVDNKVYRYSLDGSLAGKVRIGKFGSETKITRVDRLGFSEYMPQRVQEDIFRGHMGAVSFLKSSRTLAIGGFANSLMVVPFTSERSGDTFKNPSGVLSGLRGHRRYNITQAGYATGLYEGFDFPYEINEDPLRVFVNGIFGSGGVSNRESFSVGSFNLTEANFLVKYRNAWSVEFNGEEGYSSYLFFGQNPNNLNKKFDFSSTDNISYLMKTRDNGMIWSPIINNDTSQSEFPLAFASDWIFNPSDSQNIVVSTMMGIFEDSEFNSGVFVTSDSGRTWTNINDNLPVELPVKSIESIDGQIYTGTVGFGVFFDAFTDVTSGTPVWERFESRFPTLEGLNAGLWEVTAIAEDPINPSRIVIGTRQQGVLKSLDGGKTWLFDDNGIPSGSITALKLLPINPATVFAGVENDGLYKRDFETGLYSKITNGLPATSNIIDIKIDTTFDEVFNEFNYPNPSNDLILILRSTFSPPRSAPDDLVIYNVGDEIDNAVVVAINSTDYTTNVFEDRIGQIRDGVPHYYRFFTLNNDGTYTERDIIEGFSTNIEILKIEDTNADRISDPFPTSGDGLAGRVVDPSILNTSARLFEIESNTGTELILKADPFETINTGDATSNSTVLGRKFYRINSTRVIIPTKTNPIYMAAEDTTSGISKVYVSTNNGRTWTERSIGITSNTIRSLTLETLNVEERLLLPQATVYAATVDGVFRSEDNAFTWNEISSSTGVNILPNSTVDPTVDYEKVLVDLENCDNLYAMTRDGRVYRSVNNGSSWELMSDADTQFNTADIISFFTNYLFTGTTTSGIIRIENAIRDRVRVDIIADSNITFFDIDFLETGDLIDSDTNSITMNTLVKNDSISNNKEQVRFIVSERGEDIQFSIKKNDIPFEVSDIFIGDQLANPKTNPFILRTPASGDDPTVINQIVALSDGLLYAATNKGVFYTSNSGDKWNKINNAAIPDEILDVGIVNGNEIILATANGLWASSDNKTNFGIIESSGNRVNTVFESSDQNVVSLFRGGDVGLRVLVQNSRSIIAYSGLNKQMKISWGNPFDRKDGGWSENTQRIISEPVLAVTTIGETALTQFDGWDYALIVRKGPFTTFEKAQKAANNNDIFAPDQKISYNVSTLSSIYTNPTSVAVFSADDDATKIDLEEIREVNLAGSNAVGDSFQPPRYMSDGSIIVGVIPNRKRLNSQYPEEFDFGPSPDYPVVDRVQPITVGRTLPENFADEDAYDVGEVRAPVIKDNMFYLYRVYPYILLPDPLTFSTASSLYPTFPNYRPFSGDAPDAYNYNFERDDFTGGISTILSGTSIGNNNWIVGTDSGIFYSTQGGRDPNPALSQSVVGTGFSIPAVIFTSRSFAIAGVVSPTLTYLAKSTEIPIGSSWLVIPETVQSFASANVKRIFNITEDTEGNLFVATNAGIFKGDANGENWVLFGTVGDLEAMSGGKVLGQEFEVT